MWPLLPLEPPARPQVLWPLLLQDLESHVLSCVQLLLGPHTFLPVCSPAGTQHLNLPGGGLHVCGTAGLAWCPPHCQLAALPQAQCWTQTGTEAQVLLPPSLA